MLSVSDGTRTGGSKPFQSISSRARVLISDDQHDILTALALLLKMNNFATETVDSPGAALESARTNPFDLILMDLNYSRDTTSGREGLKLLSDLRNSGVSVPIVVMTAWGNVELAVEAMRLGANDFVQKPWENQRLLGTVRKELERVQSAEHQQRKAQSDLEIARHVQQKLFPQRRKTLRTLDYEAICLPAREVGGDYYDFFDVGEGRLAGVLADVSGKGVAAALLMANLQASFRSQFDAGSKQPADVLQTINRLFYASTPPEQYVTLFYFEYDDASRTMRYVNCGHLAPALLRAGGEIERLDSTGMVIGMFPHSPCECRELTLAEGDVLVVFSDGVTEFSCENGSEFGEERFLSLVQSARKLTPESALRHVTDRLAVAANGREQFDDQTIVLLRAR